MKSISRLLKLDAVARSESKANNTCLELSSKLGIFTSSSHNKCKTSATSFSLPTHKNNAVQSNNAAIDPGYSQQIHVQKLVDILHECSRKRLVKEAKVVHGYVLKSNYPDDNLLILLNHVAHTYSKCQNLTDARVIFNTMSQRNVFSWTVMVTGSTENGLFHDAFRYFCEMQNNGVFPDEFTYSSFIQLCVGLDCANLGKMVHAQIIIRGYTLNVRVTTSLLNMYAKMGHVKDSWNVFSTMTEHNEVSWNAMISGFTENGFHLQAFDCFLEMIETGFTPNKFTFVSVLKAIGKLRDVGKGKHVHKCISELDMESDVFVGTALIDMYSKCGAISDARSVFQTNFITCPLNMPWNAMLSGFVQCNCSQEVLELYLKMCQSNIKSDVYTYCSVFTAIATMRSLRFGRQVHAMVKKFGHDTMPLSVKNAIADAYSKCDSLEDVKKVFNKMEEKDVVSWTILMSCYSRCHEWEEALAIFLQMRKDGFTPNQFTFSNALVACASLCFLEFGRQLHGLIWKTGWNNENCIESDMKELKDCYLPLITASMDDLSVGILKTELERLSSLKKLEVLDLSWNLDIDNDIFPSLRTLTSLKILDLSRTGLKGYFPISEFAGLENLEVLDLSHCHLNGTFEIQGFKILRRLKTLTLWSNGFNKSIIASLSALSSLTNLDLSSNPMSGLFPAQELSRLTNIEKLDLSSTGFHGTPNIQACASLSRLRRLESIVLSANNFNKSIISCLSALPSLKILDLSYCVSLGVSFPIQEVLKFPDLEVLLVSGNVFSGTLPMEALASFHHLEVLDMSENSFSGSIPSAIQELSSLRAVSFAKNKLNGSLPDHAGLCLKDMLFQGFYFTSTSYLK
ncbi:hypothetical protein L2E82_28447 [Cichorium intybus]|uniref:Uncharacterized protein n=1 Tax=Cichorium intybus TaxID=13427 RepID=A0ACB9CW50_CICIN|nr:hypothetical protein L2E82_28447 [Cichorium intybus]